MPTRHKHPNRLGPVVVPVVCGLLLAYFVNHAFSGRHSLHELERLKGEATRLEFVLVATRKEREALEARVLLLHDGTLERDMLDEQARRTLNLLGSDEVAVPWPGAASDS